MNKTRQQTTISRIVNKTIKKINNYDRKSLTFFKKI